MDRRDAIRYTAVFMGASLSASTVASLIAGCTVDEQSGWTPKFLSEDEAHFIREFSETMLPKSTTPGAKEALVDRFIDTVRPLRFTVEENQAFKANLVGFIAQAKSELGNDFVKVFPAKQLYWLQTTDATAFETIKAKPDLKREDRPFYLQLKEQILGAYFSSEKVAKEYFAYDPIPGRYEGCIPYEQVGRAWAL